MTSQNSIIKPFKTPIFLLIGLTHFVVVKIVIIIVIIIIIIIIIFIEVVQLAKAVFSGALMH